MNIFGKTPSIPKDCICCSSASVIGDAQVGEVSSDWYGCVLRGDVNSIRVGSGTNILDNSLVHVAKSNLSGKVLPAINGDNVSVVLYYMDARLRMRLLLVWVQHCLMVGKNGMVAAEALVRQNTRIPCGEDRLSDTARKAVNDLLPDYANNNLSSLCSWADRVKFIFRWSSPLHYIDTPDNLCNYNYARDCKNEDGVTGMCVSGAINNYTNQLLSYGNTSDESKYNLTQALLFLSHFMGDIHQPLHVGFTSDKGGNTIDVHWYKKKTELHAVWDSSIIETEEEDLYDTDVDGFVDAIKKNITGRWSDQLTKWETCDKNETTCPDIYATESITAACDWAYKGVTEDSTLGDDYFQSRLPVVNLRLAEGGVRLAATLNRIFS